jgi:hypothetical protein
MATQPDSWPQLRYEDYKETKATLHMYAQIIGKLRLALTPPLAQWAHAPLRLSPDGLTTGPLWVGNGTLGIDVDLVHHRVLLQHSDGGSDSVPLEPVSVATFYARIQEVLANLGVRPQINTRPAEVPDPIPFEADMQHASYEPLQANQLWQAMIRAGAVFEAFASGYWGKQTPVSFYWGGFDLGTQRFSGRYLEPPEGLPQIMAGSLDAEVFAVGLHFGRPDMPAPGFTALAYPMPPQAASASLRPSQARWVEMPGMGGLFVLPYEAVQKAADSRQVLLEFCRSTYETVAELGGWDRQALERRPPEIRSQAA